jgi:hypothetical protein
MGDPVAKLCGVFSSTKASLLAALVFVVDKKTDLISAPHALVYFAVVIFFVYFKVKGLHFDVVFE